MSYMAQWGPKAFLVSAGVALPLEKFSATRTAKTEKLNSDDGSDRTIIKGIEPESVTLETTALRAAGVDPMKQIEEWKALVGHTASLYLGGVKFGKNMFYLKSVGTSDFLQTNAGKLLQAKISLTFDEYLTDNVYLTAHGVTQGDEIKRALSYTATAAERAARK